MSDIVTEGDHVVLLKSFDSGNMKIVPALKNTIVHYGKLHFDSSPLVGSKFGSIFEIKENTMIEVKDFEAYDSELSELVTNKLITYNDKSQFSQEKILKKKKKKNHANIVTVIRPSLLLINEMFYARDKLGGLRLDVVSQILTLANIQNGSKCLILDHNLGLISSAILSRSLPDGVCIQIVPDGDSIQTTRTTVKMLNISEEICSEKLLAVTVRELFMISEGIQDFSYQNEVLINRHQEHLSRIAEICPEHMDIGGSIDQEQNKFEEDTIKSETEPETVNRMDMEENSKKTQDSDSKKDLRNILIKKESNRLSRHNERMKATAYLKSWSLDSFILIIQNDHPLPLLKLSYPLLAPSRQFVIYCDFIEPLLECHQYLKSGSLAVSLSLSESWLRRYQVLPDRTRPEMNIAGCGGYLLSGIKALTGSLSGIELEKLRKQ